MPHASASFIPPNFTCVSLMHVLFASRVCLSARTTQLTCIVLCMCRSPIMRVLPSAHVRYLKCIFLKHVSVSCVPLKIKFSSCNAVQNFEVVYAKKIIHAKFQSNRFINDLAQAL